VTLAANFFALGGGLDLVTPAIQMPAGRVIAALNYEPVANGYRRLIGFERFDGRAAPSDGGTRSDITAIPGSGPVKGVFRYNGDTYAVRLSPGGGPADSDVDYIYKATAGGWIAIEIGSTLQFSAGGPHQLVEGDVITGPTSGASAVVKFVDLAGGTWAASTAAGTLTIAPTGIFNDGEVAKFGGVNVATVTTQASQYLGNSTGYEFVVYNFLGSAGSERLYFSADSSGALYDYDGSSVLPYTDFLSPVPPVPAMAVYKNSLFVGFEGGSLQFSAPGEPRDFDAIDGAGEIGVGDEIVALVPLASALVVLCRTSVAILYGNDASDFQFEVLSRASGALASTAQLFGDVVYMDNAGLRSLRATQAYGNFTVGTITQTVAPLLEQNRKSAINPVASLLCRTSNQYWLFFSDGSGLIVFLGRGMNKPEVMPFNLGKTVTCAASTEDSGVERIFVGCDDGFVYELNKGSSFDGSAIEHYVRLPFWHMGSPRQKKRIAKVTIELKASGTTTLGVSADINYGAEPGIAAQALVVTTGGGSIGSLGSNEAYFAAQLNTIAEAWLGEVAQNVSLKVSGSTTEEAHTLTGVAYHVSPRGLAR
jgi:hypothetical protein